MNDDKVFDLAREVSAMQQSIKHLQGQQDEIFNEVKKVRHELKSEQLNKDFKKSVVKDYKELKNEVKTLSTAIKTGGWIIKNWKLISVVLFLLFTSLTTTTIDFGDKLLNTEPPKKHQKV